MGYSFIVSVALVMGLMLSPDSLVLLGNHTRLAGISFIVVILLAGISHILTALSYGELFALYPGEEGEACFIRAALGSVPAILFPVCSMIVSALCVSTGIIVTAGFVFNEVFLYWFPNFTFAFLLLGFLMMINLMGRGIAEKFQIFFVTSALSGLLFLSAFALIRSGHPPSMLDHVRPTMNLKIGSIGLLLFLGFDLVGFINQNRGVKDFLLSKIHDHRDLTGRGRILFVVSGICYTRSFEQIGGYDNPLFSHSTKDHGPKGKNHYGMCGACRYLQCSQCPVYGRIPNDDRHGEAGFAPPFFRILVLLSGFVGLLWIEDSTAQLIKFMMIVFGVILFCSLIRIRFARKKGWMYPK